MIALIGGISIGLFYISNRKLADGTPAVVMLAHSVLIGAVRTSFAVPFVWVPPRAADLPPVAGFVVCALVGQGLLMASFTHVPASIVAPFQYRAIISATLFGFIVLGEFPDWLTIAGIVVVVASGVYIALREGRVKKKGTRPVSVQVSNSLCFLLP
ncbi:MAG: DMT family transporter [Proteobacteria bacterium]|nr:DMT family transporter [Pseudomonadota bacterium]